MTYVLGLGFLKDVLIVQDLVGCPLQGMLQDFLEIQCRGCFSQQPLCCDPT